MNPLVITTSRRRHDVGTHDKAIFDQYKKKFFFQKSGVVGHKVAQKIQRKPQIDQMVKKIVKSNFSQNTAIRPPQMLKSAKFCF